MTLDQCPQSAYTSELGDRHLTLHAQQHAHDEPTTMPGHGPLESPDIGVDISGPSEAPKQVLETAAQQETDGSESAPAETEPHPPTTTVDFTHDLEPRSSKRSLPTAKQNSIIFADFAAQVRLQTHYARRSEALESRKRLLQKAVALSTRLLRTSYWVRDGLVEISKHADPTGFVRVFQHAQDLVDLCYSQWTQEINSLDPVLARRAESDARAGQMPVMTQLTDTARADLLDLVYTLRSKPDFLIERFKNLSPSQVAALSTHPRWQDPAESEAFSMFHDRGRNSRRRKRVNAFSKSLEDYASSFERSNPLSFLLFNVYGADQHLHSDESQLRMSTWSTICAQLLLHSPEAYHKLHGQVLDAFANIHGWHAKDRVELFLMDLLQKGAFLLEPTRTSEESGMTTHNQLHTQQAHDFFDQAICDLLVILRSSGGGYPTGAFELASAILGKLPDEVQQGQFRGHFLTWFLDYFLSVTISYPENENMLLQVHISNQARHFILYQFSTRATTLIREILSQNVSRPIRMDLLNDIADSVDFLINALVESPSAATPYPQPPGATHSDHGQVRSSTVTICAAEIVQVLEALSPQAIHAWSSDPIMSSITSAFHAQYSRASSRFDRLKRELLERIVPPGSSAKDIHPCHERWFQLVVDSSGGLRAEVYSNGGRVLTVDQTGLTTVQQAAIRICTELDTDVHVSTDVRHTASLHVFLEDRMAVAQSQADAVETMYWRHALRQLRSKHALALLARDDTYVLAEPLARFKRLHLLHVEQCTQLEKDLSGLERSYSVVKTNIDRFASCLRRLRVKLWYSVSVAGCKGYDDARNVVTALNHMARSWPIKPRHSVSERPMSSRSSASSIFDQAGKDTMNLLKAPTEHGGPRKLADDQIENIKKWLKQDGIDNFCKGEERLHRFCMEVKTLSQRLVGESMTDGAVLWSSELFAREAALFDIHALTISSAPASTRPASVASETFSMTAAAVRPSLRSVDSDSRSVMSEDRGNTFRRTSVYNLFQNRINRDSLVPELASSIGSYGRASTTTTAESACSIWSSPPPPSETSASDASRPPSLIPEPRHARLLDVGVQKTTFLEGLQQGLMCLLLSDLGCMLWSWGSETDAWLGGAHQTPAVMSRMRRRLDMEAILTNDRTPMPVPGGPLQEQTSRRRSLDSVLNQASAGVYIERSSQDPAATVERLQSDFERDYLQDLKDVLMRLSQHIDPVTKLRAVKDFSKIAMLQLQARIERASHEQSSQGEEDRGHPVRDGHPKTPFRSASLSKRGSRAEKGLANVNQTLTERAVTEHIKKQLLLLQPRTLFRDLQYIAAFSPPEMLDKTSDGKAFLQFGLAALAYKNEICQSMVDISTGVMLESPMPRASLDGPTGNSMDSMLSLSIQRAAEYWKVAAREGNAQAQRELATLYLSHPEVLPVVTPPLALSTDIFKEEMMWVPPGGLLSNRQALCLALHWMQLAAKNGDAIAKQKLEERQMKLKYSIR